LKKLISIDCERGNWDSALMSCFELRKSAERERDLESLAFALYHEGMVEVAQNRWDDALESYLGAIERYMEIGDRKGVCEINRAMGVIYGNKGDYVSALRCFDNSLTMALDIGDRALQAKAEANLAIMYDLQGRMEEAERANEHCLAYFLENGDLSNAARVANNLGVLNVSRERFQVSAEYFDKTIHAGRSLTSKEVLARGLVNGGYCYARLGQTSRALQYTDESISLLKEPNDLNMLALAYRNYGYIESKSSNMEKGGDWFEKSIRMAKASGVEDTYAACCYEYGMALIRSTVNLSLAKKLLKRAATTYKDIGNIDIAKRIESRTPSL
jgi:tetratricopeptide (TPR) repeat protein